MQYLLETEHYENYLMLDSDTFTQRGYQDIWREAAEAVLLYQVPHAASQPMTARISHTLSLIHIFRVQQVCPVGQSIATVGNGFNGGAVRTQGSDGFPDGGPADACLLYTSRCV